MYTVPAMVGDTPAHFRRALKKIVVLAFAIAGVSLPWLGGGYIWLGFFALIAGLLILVRPDAESRGDPAAQAEHHNLVHGHPSRDATRTDYFLHDPLGGGGPGDGGAV